MKAAGPKAIDLEDHMPWQCSKIWVDGPLSGGSINCNANCYLQDTWLCWQSSISLNMNMMFLTIAESFFNFS